jgi:hypothetical protein
MADKGFEGLGKNITLLVVFGTALYHIYKSNFLQSSIINDYWNENFYKIIIIASISFIFLLLYVIFKGFEDIEENPIIKLVLSNSAKRTHTLFLTLFLMILLYFILSFTILIFPINYRNWGGFFLIVGWVFFLLLILSFLGRFCIHYIFGKKVKRLFAENYELEQESLERERNYSRSLFGFFILFIKLVFLFIICMFIWLIPFSLFLNVPIPTSP